jgi:hypothetical protein
MATGHKKQAVQAQSNRNTSNVVVSAPVAGQARPLPSDVTPKPPTNAIDVDAKTRSGRKPRALHIVLAPQLAAEFLANKEAYSDEFGPKAPDPDALAAGFTLAVGWSGVAQDADTWASYTDGQATFAWNDALGRMAGLKPLYQAALLRDPTIAEKFPVMARVFAIPAVAAQKGANTRKERAKKAKGGQSTSEAEATGTTDAAATNAAATTTHVAS